MGSGWYSTLSLSLSLSHTHTHTLLYSTLSHSTILSLTSTLLLSLSPQHSLLKSTLNITSILYLNIYSLSISPQYFFYHNLLSLSLSLSLSLDLTSTLSLSRTQHSLTSTLSHLNTLSHTLLHWLQLSKPASLKSHCSTTGEGGTAGIGRDFAEDTSTPISRLDELWKLENQLINVKVVFQQKPRKLAASFGDNSAQVGQKRRL